MKKGINWKSYTEKHQFLDKSIFYYIKLQIEIGYVEIKSNASRFTRYAHKLEKAMYSQTRIPTR